MVREVRLEIDFPLCTPQEFFEAIYAEEEGLKIYHKLNSTEEGAEVTPWVDGERTVSFYKELELPAAISYLFGTNKLPVKEGQRLKRLDDGAFTVFSSPELQVLPIMPAPNEITLLDQYGVYVFGDDGTDCAIKESKIGGVETFLTFCEARIAEKKVDRRPYSDADSDSLAFYDVQDEMLSQCSLPDGAIAEMKENNTMLTTEAIILTRIKHLEEELKISQSYADRADCVHQQGLCRSMEAITKKVETLELALLRSRRQTTVALVGCTALSFAVVTTVLLLKRSSYGH